MQAAGVGDEIRCVQDPRRGERFAVLGPGELVVRRAGDHPAPQLGHRFARDDAAQRARSEDVAVECVDFVRPSRLDAEVPNRPRDGVEVDVGHGHLRAAVFDQMFHQRVADLAHALNRDPPALQRVLVPHLFRSCQHRQVDPVRGKRRRVARSTGRGVICR